jgi:hypothetical protein
VTHIIFFDPHLADDTKSAPLDSHGNSVRGLDVCEALYRVSICTFSTEDGDVRTGIMAECNIAGISSRHNRQLHEQRILDRHHEHCHVRMLARSPSVDNVQNLSHFQD